MKEDGEVVFEDGPTWEELWREFEKLGDHLFSMTGHEDKRILIKQITSALDAACRKLEVDPNKIKINKDQTLSAIWDRKVASWVTQGRYELLNMGSITNQTMLEHFEEEMTFAVKNIPGGYHEKERREDLMSHCLKQFTHIANDELRDALVVSLSQKYTPSRGVEFAITTREARELAEKINKEMGRKFPKPTPEKTLEKILKDKTVSVNIQDIIKRAQEVMQERKAPAPQASIGRPK